MKAADSNENTTQHPAAPRMCSPCQNAASQPAAHSSCCATPGAHNATFERMRQVVDQAPDIRADRVAAARLALKNGTLPLSGAALAEAMLRTLRRGC